MKRFVLLALAALGLSGCVSEGPYDGYRPYPVAGPVIVDDYGPYDRYDRPPVYRDYRPRYGRAYPPPPPPRYGRYDRYDRPVRVGRRFDDPRRYDDRRGPDRPRPVRPQPLPRPGPGPIAAPEVVRTDLPDQPRYRQLQKQRAAQGGPRPYIPPVPLD